MYDTPLTIPQNLALLAATPSRLAKITKGLSPAQLVTPPEPGEWSLRDVLAHLRACADMWGKYIVVILSEDHPTFKAMNPTTWIKHTNYLEQAFKPSLKAYSAHRAELLAVLEPLPPEAWSRAATVMTAGKPRERTVQTYAMWLANHERSHFSNWNALPRSCARSLKKRTPARHGSVTLPKSDRRSHKSATLCNSQIALALST